MAPSDARPSDVLDALFDVAGGDHDAFVARVAAHYESSIGVRSVPFLTDRLLKTHASQPDAPVLVRWRCMVSDTGIGTELIVPWCDVEGRRVHLLYGAESRAPPDVVAEPLVERTVVGASSIPGETKWARQVHYGDALEDAIADLELESSRAPLHVQLKLYDNKAADELRPAELVDVIGTLDMCIPSSAWPDEADGAAEPLPCIHVLALRRERLSAIADSIKTSDALDGKARYDALVHYIADSLAGDVLAAEYVALSLIARIHWRTPGAAVGALSVNIFHADDLCAPLSDALSHVCPAVATQSLALATLNDASAPLFPQGTDYGLCAGRLQLVDGTVLLVDEAAMGEGQLGDTGVRNVRALSQLISRHTLPYLFPYSEFEVNTDVNVLVLSAGRTFLPVDVHIPWRPSTSARRAPDTTQHVLDALRTAILHARVASLEVPDTVSERIQAFFVERRKTDATYSQDDLQRQIGIARLLALGSGASVLGEAEWSRAVELENLRAERFST
ncbi:hypothetical protein MCUN1_001478 [Malassezia cuniculi]|uniref:Mini-chromosome maintenance complex-binding protein n=1 Tax=Malassezia cuniculi TaxID=948313 RepID=A0AAF0EU50_9BASI|nr:hypothetical protein MCUN1_001478 [Malassezia cuniculi]